MHRRYTRPLEAALYFLTSAFLLKQGYRRAASILDALGAKDRAQKFIQAGIHAVESAGRDVRLSSYGYCSWETRSPIPSGFKFACVHSERWHEEVFCKTEGNLHGNVAVRTISPSDVLFVLEFKNQSFACLSCLYVSYPPSLYFSCEAECPQGRHTILAQPSLWTTLRLTRESSAKRLTGAVVQRLQGRSLKQLIFALSKPDLINAIARELQPAMSGLRELTLSLDKQMLPSRVLVDLLLQAHHSLQVLRLRASATLVDINVPFVDFLRSFPLLRVLDMQSTATTPLELSLDLSSLLPDPSTYSDDAFNLLLKQLVLSDCFRFDQPTVDTALIFPQMEYLLWGTAPLLAVHMGRLELKDMCNLRTLHTSAGYLESQLSGMTATTLENVEQLDLNGKMARGNVHLTLPSLKSFTLRQDSLPAPELLYSISQDSPQLQELHLHSCAYLEPRNILSLLPRWPEIARLSISHSLLAKGLIETIVKEGLLPQLHSLELSHIPDLRASPLIALVRRGSSSQDNDASGRPFARITRLVLKDCDQLEREGIQWLRSQVPTFQHRYTDPNVFKKNQQSRLEGREASKFPVFFLLHSS